jgi:drug/metabolite transporter (DMT)-like permease
VFFLILLIRSGFPKLSKSDHKKLFLTAFFEPGLYFTFETMGLTYTTASKASIIISIVPITVMLLARVVLKEKINGRSLLGILLSVIGILILVLGDPKFSISFEGSMIGDLLILGAVISSSLYIIFARDLGQRLSSLEITSFQIFYGTIFFTPAFILNAGSIKWTQVSAEAIGAIIFLTIFATILSFLFYNFALTQIPASRAAIFINGIPVVTAIGAWIILGERLTLLQVMGGLLVLAAVMIANLSSKGKIDISITS